MEGYKRIQGAHFDHQGRDELTIVRQFLLCTATGYLRGGNIHNQQQVTFLLYYRLTDLPFDSVRCG